MVTSREGERIRELMKKRERRTDQERKIESSSRGKREGKGLQKVRERPKETLEREGKRKQL